MKSNYAFYTDVGDRHCNEDACDVTSTPQGLLLVVADGLGGHDSGDIASALTVETVKSHVFALSDASSSIRAANARILQEQTVRSSAMKSTVAFALIGEKITVLAHVGDTRLYAFGAGRMLYRSCDHSVAQLAVTVGEIPASALRGHKDLNKLTRALGICGDVLPELVTLPTASIDGLVLCSDGFWQYVTGTDMLREQTDDATMWLSRLRALRESRANEGNDNHTAIVWTRGEATM